MLKQRQVLRVCATSRQIITGVVHCACNCGKGDGSLELVKSEWNSATVPGFIRHSLFGNAKSVGITNKEIPVHVVSCRNSRSGIFRRFKSVAGVQRNSAGVNDSNRIEHWAAVFVEEHLISHDLPNDL